MSHLIKLNVISPKNNNCGSFLMSLRCSTSLSEDRSVVVKAFDSFII